MIVCGWCHADTTPGSCSSCGRDPALPWVQRAMEPPAVTSSERNRRLLAQAEQAIRERGLEPTTERIAEQIGRDPRTVRRMRREVSADVRSAT